MGVTSIEWVRNDDGSPGHSWPIVNGCRRISPGCGGASGVGGCYAERLISTRLSKTKKYGGLAVFGKNGPRWTGESRLWLPDLDMPLRLRKPTRIFVADMGDLFYEEVTNEEIAAVYGVMAQSPRHTFIVLTKRAERLAEWYRWVSGDGEPHAPPADHVVTTCAVNLVGDMDQIARPWPLPNVWVGVSVEDQSRANARIPHLLRVPAAVRLLSVEPQLEDMDLNVGSWGEGFPLPSLEIQARQLAAPGTSGWKYGHHPLRALDWVINGGESGPGARPFDLAWARSIVRQCADAEVACFVKQMGSNAHDSARSIVGGWAPSDPEPDTRVRFASKKGGDMSEWPNDLRVRQFPRTRAA